MMMMMMVLMVIVMVMVMDDNDDDDDDEDDDDDGDDGDDDDDDDDCLEPVLQQNHEVRKISRMNGLSSMVFQRSKPLSQLAIISTGENVQKEASG